MKNYTEYIFISDYLADFIKNCQEKNPAFSIRSFALKLKYKNNSLIQDVIKKKRKPTAELVMKMSAAYKFPLPQKKYLLKICELERAKTVTERDQILIEIRILQNERAWKFYDLKNYDFVNYPYINIIYALIALKDFEPTPAFCNKHLRIKVTDEQLKHALTSMLESGYIEKKNDGHYQYCESNIVRNSSEDLEKLLVIKYHSEILKIVQEIYPQVEREERDVRTTCLALKKSDFLIITEEIKKLHQSVGTYGVDSDADEMYIFTSQMVPVSKRL
jgi:uncharacterized protein (TIGR02147 family)